MYLTEANNCIRKPPEKDELKEGQECPRPAGPKALGRPAWPLFNPSGAPLWPVYSSLSSLLMFFKFFAEALGLRVSAEHGGRQPPTEERHVAPWWDERPEKLLHGIRQGHPHHHHTSPRIQNMGLFCRRKKKKGSSS